MIKKLWMRLNLHFFPPKVGDVYFGDAFMFMIPGYNIEKILHRTLSITGETIWEPILGEGDYKLTIESDSMPYYKCKGELLATFVQTGAKDWVERRTKRRINKKQFIEMILSGELRK